jgi:hypothetical protein
MKRSYTIFADYHQFYLWDKEIAPDAPTDYTDADVEKRIKTAPNVVVIQPERNMGVPVELTLRSRPLPPVAGRCAIKRRAAPLTYNVRHRTVDWSDINTIGSLNVYGLRYWLFRVGSANYYSNVSRRVRQAWRVTSSVKVRWPGFAEPKARRRARASPRGGV